MRRIAFPFARLVRAGFGGLAALAVCHTLILPAARAEDVYPNKPVRVIVNYAAGGPVDTVARLLGEKLQASLKQAFVIDNRSGGGGIIGAQAVTQAQPDGYTLLLGVDTAVTVNPALYPSLPYKPGDLKPVMVLTSAAMTVVANPSFGVNTLKELIEKGKKEPLNFSSAGNASGGHLAAEMLGKATGIKVVHVPYRGNAPAVTALLAGEIPVSVFTTPGVVPHVKSGRMKALAVTGEQRSELLPDVPTAKELGYPDITVEFYYTLFAPANTPEPVMKTLQTALSAALDAPDVKARLKSMDFVTLKTTGKAADDLLAKTRDRYTRLIKEIGMKAE